MLPAPALLLEAAVALPVKASAIAELLLVERDKVEVAPWKLPTSFEAASLLLSEGGTVVNAAWKEVKGDEVEEVAPSQLPAVVKAAVVDVAAVVEAEAVEAAWPDVATVPKAEVLLELPALLCWQQLTRSQGKVKNHSK